MQSEVFEEQSQKSKLCVEFIEFYSNIATSVQFALYFKINSLVKPSRPLFICQWKLQKACGCHQQSNEFNFATI